MICFCEDIVIRKLKDDYNDYELMAKWLSDEEVLKFYQGRDNPSDINQIIKKYRPRIIGESSVISCIIEYNKKSIGYIQYYPIEDEEKDEFCYDKSELIYGIDVFIGEVELQNKNIGRKAIKSLTLYIQNSMCPDRIIIDPRKDNIRAIKCYEKCGFVIKKLLSGHELHEGVYCDNYLMEIECKKRKMR